LPVSPLAKKLLIKPGFTIAVLNAPPGYADKLREGADNVTVSEQAAGQSDLVQLYVKNSEELARLAPEAVQSVRPSGLLWICYPKQSAKTGSDLNRDVLWKIMGQYGVVGVSLISIDDTWSCMRFRPTAEVGR
jgi:hypothetical protein